MHLGGQNIFMKKILIAILSLMIIAGLVLSVFVLANNKSSNSTSTDDSTRNLADSSSDSSGSSSSKTNTSSSQTITLEELKLNNGLNNKPCWVAADGIVYLVPVGTKDWRNGSHDKSNGEVKCGMDTGTVITSSPHGSSVLGDLTKLGTLK
jgi:predicted heme/steroid binding protein